MGTHSNQLWLLWRVPYLRPAAREWGQDCLVTVSGAFFQISEATSTWRPLAPSSTVVAVFWWLPVLTLVSLPRKFRGFLAVLHGAQRALYAGAAKVALAR